MSSREKRMLIILAIFGIGGILFAGYSLFLKPWQKHKADQAQLALDESDKSDELASQERKLKKLADLKKRSLPAETDVAKREYEATLSHLMRTAGVPAGYTITPKDSADLGKIPTFADKKPVFSRFGYDIRMQKVDLQILAKVLKSYYDLNLLHQITHLEIKHIEKENSGGPTRRGGERADLEVILHTEAVILNGAENRQTLTQVPVAVAAAGGAVAYRAAQNLPEFSRVMKPTPLQPLLAYTKGNTMDTRDYLAMAARDVFHGPLPKVIEERVPEPKRENPFEVVAKEDISPFLKLNGIATGTDGNREATIWDIANNYFYEIFTKEGIGGKPEYRVGKFYYLEGKRKPFGRESELIIEEGKNVSTKHKFKIIGFYRDGLMLSETTVEGAEKVVDPKEQPKKGTGRPGATAPGGGKTPNTKESSKTKEAPKAKAKIAGEEVDGDDLPAAPVAVAVAPPAAPVEKFYLWRIGQTLKTVTDLPLSYRERSVLLANIAEPKFTVALETAPVPRGAAN